MPVAGRNTEPGRRIREAVMHGIPEALRQRAKNGGHDRPSFFIFSRFKGEHWVEWTPENCPYFPCHFPGQRCDFCYCPFYPCHDEDLGQWVESSNGKKVWNCARCTLLHEPAVADYLKQFPGASLKELVTPEKIPMRKIKKFRALSCSRFYDSMLLLVDAERLEELGKGDAVCFGGLPDRLAPGNCAPDTAHAELEEGFGCLGLCLEQVIDCTVSVDFSHITPISHCCLINLTIAAESEFCFDTFTTPGIQYIDRQDLVDSWRCMTWIIPKQQKESPVSSQKAGQTVDAKKIEGKLRRLVDEFGVQPSEAERSVTNELAKEFNIPLTGSGGGAGKSSGGTEQKKIADAVPGEWVTIEGKVVSVSAPASPSIAQSGMIADESGAIRFVAWAKANAPAMAAGSWYRIESAVVDEYKGVASLKIHSGTTIKEISSEDRALIPATVPIKGPARRHRQRPRESRPGMGRIPRTHAPVRPSRR